MTQRQLIFVTHPEVTVDPACPVPDWSLSDKGRARARTFAASDLMAHVSHIWTSTERKAQETAAILAKPRGLPVTVDQRLSENDRAATGYMPQTEFARAADAFFYRPDQSHLGWERAVDAQARILAAVRQIVSRHFGDDLAIVSHGAVGTLLYCALSGRPIDREYDQPFQGHWWTADLTDLVPRARWAPIG
jgi:broad specificity phosphatase PhoE